MKTFINALALALAGVASTAHAHGNTTYTTNIYGTVAVGVPNVLVTAGGYALGYPVPYGYGPYAPVPYSVQYQEINHVQILTVEEQPTRVTPVNAPNTATSNGIPYRPRTR